MKNLPRKRRNSKRSHKINANWETPIFERLEPRLLLNADIYGLTAGQEPIAPLETSIEVDLNEQAASPVGETTSAPIAQSIPYTQDFSSGKPDSAAGWEYYSDTVEGRIQVVSERLRMDDTTGSGGAYTLNEAILHLDLTGKTNVTLTLDHWSISDENTSILDNFTDHYKGDGIALSVDGVNWIKVTDLAGSFTAQSFALDSIIDLAKDAAGSDDVSDVRIKFQQYDNYPSPDDGREFDNIEVTTNTVQSIPYTQDFELGVLPGNADGWEYFSNTPEGRIQVVGGRLRMDDTTGSGGVYTLNEAILHVDLTGKANITLTLDHWSIGDENTSILDSFTGHYKGDGIALSVDGINWIKVTDLTGNLTEESFALDAIIELAKTAAGSDDVSDVRIKFQQYDNYPADSDGREFDNIKVTSEIAQSVPYTQDFESGLPELKDGWEYYSNTAEGRIQVVDGRLRMDDNTGSGGVYTLNEAILHVDLTGKANITLTLDHWSINDESTGILDSFTDHYKGDGIALSVDGVNWIKITDLTGNLTEESFALDAIIELAKTAAGSDDVSDVRIKFQQYDNYPADSDGREFDNIKVTSEIAQSVPYTQDFESGLPELKDGWEYYSNTAEGRIQIVDGRLRMDDTTGSGGLYTLNEAILHVDLTGKTNIILILDHTWINDEYNAIPENFTEHYKGDGISLSVDGFNWVRITNLGGSFTAESFALDAIIELAKTAAGSDDVSDVRIKFQQYDNYPANSDGREFDNINVTANIAQSVPYTQDFESGLPELKDGWEYFSNTPEGRIQIVGGRLRMDDTTGSGGVYTLNEAILHVDLTGKTDVTLTLDHWDLTDEDTGIPASFTGHYKGDGIALSVDGVNWVRITNLAGSFTAKSFALDSIIDLAKDAAGSDDVSDVRIKFQQYDNYPANSDGREFDNIQITAT